jgi:hypothetical protein
MSPVKLSHKRQNLPLAVIIVLGRTLAIDFMKKARHYSPHIQIEAFCSINLFNKLLMKIAQKYR